MKTRNVEAMTAELAWVPPFFQDVFFSIGTQEILHGILLHIEKTQPGFRRMTRKQLAATAAKYLSDYDALVEIVSREYPPGAALLKGPTDLVTSSLLRQLGAALSDAQRPRWHEW
jgi:hypothetical protein